MLKFRSSRPSALYKWLSEPRSGCATTFEKKSYRNPMFNVRLGRTLQSSCTKNPYSNILALNSPPPNEALTLDVMFASRSSRPVYDQTTASVLSRRQQRWVYWPPNFTECFPTCHAYFSPRDHV